MIKGIDVSSYQGRIDWTKVKPHIDFAILRCGFGNNIRTQDDTEFERNAEMCERLGIPYGTYLFSYATNLDDAKSEVEHTLRLIKEKKLEYPVFLDVETKRQMALPKARLTEIVKYYCEEMEKAGYYVGIYASLDRLKSNLDSPELDAFDKWVAEWNDRFTYNKPAGMWQNTSREDMPGINGRVDGDVAFYDYPKIIRDAKLNHLEPVNEDLIYKKGDKVFVSGNIYDDSSATEVKKTVCDQEYTIEEVLCCDPAPYKIEDGYVKPESVYTKER